ncbi:MAG: cell division protein FtsZ [Proteobacteria bacterium]|jgi:cell division protein FtsZ|nr:cell division protein FtsZ [Pseudomonadota bacterium]
MIELLDAVDQQAVIKVVGVGGGGGNAVNYMVDAELEGVDFILANTDAQALQSTKAHTVLQLGATLTKGLGAGADPEVGRQAAIEDRERIADALAGADMVFITAGMGGGTGTGGAPVVAEIARELGALSVAVVTKPFDFEGSRRAKIAQQGLEALAQSVDSLITIPNQRLMDVMGKDASLQDAFGEANDVLRSAVQGISELITRPGLINVDFADVRTVMSEMGQAMMGSAIASGPNRALDAAKRALSSPLLEKTHVSGARGILVNVTAGPDLSIGEFGEIGTIIRDIASDDATVVIGTAIDSSLGNNLRVTMVATGLEQNSAAGSGQEKPYKVVQPVQRTVNGPDISDEDMLYHRRASYDARSSLEDADELDIPTFLRRQAD